MNTLTKFIFSAWKDGDRKACMISAQIPGSKLRYISFYMSQKEFESFVTGTCSLVDGAHNLRSFGDNVMFYDLNFPTDSHGEMTVPYVSVNFPIFCRKILLRWAQKQWGAVESHRDRPEINVSTKTLVRWSKNYGTCSGQVRLVVKDSAKEQFVTVKNNSYKHEGNFHDNLRKLVTIGKGYTSRFYETVDVVLSKDWDGFNFHFEKYNPRGLSRPVGLYGGLVNHSRDSKPDWSLHT